MCILFLRQLHFHPVRELNKPSSSVVLVVVLRTHLWFRDLSVPTYDTCSLSQLHQLWLIYKRYIVLLSSFRYRYCCTHQNVQVLRGKEGDPEDMRPRDHECFVCCWLCFDVESSSGTCAPIISQLPGALLWEPLPRLSWEGENQQGKCYLRYFALGFSLTHSLSKSPSPHTRPLHLSMSLVYLTWLFLCVYPQQWKNGFH